MLAILSAPGSRGDVNPMIAIGRELRSRGHDVVISLAEPYAELAEQADLEPVSLLSREHFAQVLSDPAVWRPLRGLHRVVQTVAKTFLQPHHELIARRHRPGETVLVSHPLDFASRVFRDHCDLPLIDVHLAPMLLRTPTEPPRLTPWGIEPPIIKRLFRFGYWVGDRMVLDPMLASAVNRLRRDNGLSPVKRLMNDWWLSPDRVIALYPEWFAPATVGHVPQLMHAGFPLDDASNATDDEPIRSWAMSAAPIVFTAGTANHHTRGFFEKAVQTCVALDRPGLLLSTHRENFPPGLPDNVKSCHYAALSTLLPHCAMIVHHGGIGTTSQAFATGTTQLIRPMAFDQFDNATRVTRLGCGTWLRKDRDLTETIRHYLDDRSTQESVDAIARRFQGLRPTAEIVADEIESSLA
ncbi:glycosyltransferase [Stieleria varia]|uniref:MurG-like transferase n=1 Tax=Stieleria varia TaxID=2528005 RepID=A0A5C6A1A8_9BACT|nr:nucleotide disphospho-sugar-binding domain-containing protein [Stieleria varia]TWT93206.1 MurG-like transferase [Stieleria varia]